MRVDFDNLNPPAWFDHPEHEGTRILLRIASAEDARKISKKHTTKKVEYRRGQRFEFEKTNEKKRNSLLWQFCIIDWENIFTVDGNQVPCTDENKIILMEKSPTFVAWVNDCLDVLNQDGADRVESAEKN